MWTIWKEEVYKIISRKVVWCGFFLLLGFLTFRLIMAVQYEYTATIDGKTYQGKEAIQKDQELASRFAGPLTEEKVMEIYDEYGFYYYDREQKQTVGNFWNKYITDNFTNSRQLLGDDVNEIQFYEGEDWERNAAPILKGDLQFDYISGWNDLRETYGITAVWMVFVIFIIGLSPIFSEEYSLKTADILLTTRRGKTSVIWMKMAAAMFFAAVSFCIVTAYTLLLYLIVFGTQGLDASPVLLGLSLSGYLPDTIGGLILFMFATGVLGALLLTGIVLAVSAFCKNSFLAVIVSLAAFLIPVAWIKIFAPMWLLGVPLTKAVNHFMVSMPVYLPMGWGFSFTGGQTVLHIVIALAVGAVCILLGHRWFKRYQG